MLRLIACWAWRSIKRWVGMGHYTAFIVNEKPPSVLDGLKKLAELVEVGEVDPVCI
jgi:hypothetical protein